MEPLGLKSHQYKIGYGWCVTMINLLFKTYGWIFKAL